MDFRLRRPRAAAFGLLGLALVPAAPFLGWRPLALLACAILGYVLVGRCVSRVRTPEYALAASWAFSQGVIATAIALTGGVESYGLGWLLVPLVGLPARFGARGVAAGVAFTSALVIAIALGVESSEPLPEGFASSSIIVTFLAVAVVSSALMRSDVDHRTEAVIDGLTGMLNRRALEQRLQELVAQAEISRQPVAVIAADVDHFKRINDTLGHATGDAVLVEVAYRLRKQLRAFDLAYRIGGEEFLVVLPGATVDTATVLADGLRRAVAADTVAGVAVTMSFGVAATPGGPFDAAAVLADADAALYAAKAAGRDRVVA
jgi:diguanylate cyclase (GGDEF)-like protein